MKIKQYQTAYTKKNFSSTPQARIIAREVYKKLDLNVLEYAKNQGLSKSAILDILQNENIPQIQDKILLQDISNKLISKLQKLAEALRHNATHKELKREFKLTKVTTTHLYSQYEKMTRNNEIIQMYKECKDKGMVAEKFNVCVGTISLITRCGNAFKDLLKNREQKIKEMLEKGISSKDIAEAVGISRSMVQRTARKLGCPLKRGGHRVKK